MAMKNKIKEETWKFIEETLEKLKENEEYFIQIIDVIDVNPESNLVESFYKNVDLIIDSLSKLINDKENWLEFFVFHCDFGRNKMEAGFKDEIKKIDSFEKLRWIIETDVR